MGTSTGTRHGAPQATLSARERRMLLELEEHGSMGTGELVAALRRNPGPELRRPSRISHLSGGLSVDQAYRALRRMRDHGLVTQDGPYAPWSPTALGRWALRNA